MNREPLDLEREKHALLCQEVARTPETQGYVVRLEGFSVRPDGAIELNSVPAGNLPEAIERAKKDGGRIDVSGTLIWKGERIRYQVEICQEEMLEHPPEEMVKKIIHQKLTSQLFRKDYPTSC